MFSKWPISLPIRHLIPIALLVYVFILTLWLFWLHEPIVDHGSIFGHSLTEVSAPTLIIGVLFYFTITQRVTALLSAVNRFAQGEWEARVGLSGADEFAQIGAAFDQMADKLTNNAKKQQQVEKVLQESNSRLQSVLATLDVVIWSINADGTHYHYLSPAIEHIYGRPLEDFIANSQLWLEAIHPDDRNRVLAPQQRDDLDNQSLDYRIIRPNGEIRWLNVRVFPVYDDRGVLQRTDGVAVDITEVKRSQEALRTSEERLRLALEGAQDGVWDWNVVTDEVSFNQQWAAILGYDLNEIEHHARIWEQLAHPDDYKHATEVTTAHLQGFTPFYECEYRLRTKTGEWKWILDRGRVVARDEAGRPLRMTGTYKDISKRKQAEEVLQNFFRLSLDILCIAAKDGYLKTVNPAFEQSLGYTSAELLAAPFLNFVHPQDVESTLTAFNQQTAGKEVVDFENRYRCKDGSYRWFSWRATAFDENSLIYAVARDVTEQKRQNRLITQTHRAAQVGGWEWDFITRQVYWTEETYRIYDTTPTEYTPTLETILAFYTPESISTVTAVMQQPRTVETFWDFELELITAKQRRIWVHIIGKVESDNGQVVRAYGSIQDITERKQTEVALRQSESRNRAILGALPDLVFVCDPNGLLLDAHSPDENLYYASPQAFLGKVVDQVLPAPLGTQMLQGIQQAITGNRQIVEYSLITHGETRYFEARLVPLESDKVLTIVRDVTERKQAEEERFVRKIAAAAPYMMYVYDLQEQRHVYVNRQVSKDLGYSPEEFLRLGAEFPTALLHPEDLQRFPSLHTRWDTARDGEVVETDYRMKHIHGEWRWFSGRDTVFTRTPEGRVHQIIGTAQDITEQKRAQQQILTALKEKEALLKEVHHRVKNNLQIISSLLNLQAAQIKDSAVLAIFTETKNRVRSMALLHETLYRSENLARIDFPRYVDSLCAYLFRSFGVDMSRIELQTAIAPVTLDLDRAIPCGLIINELVSNAVKYAFPDQRAGRVTVELQELPQQIYQLRVCDNGIGLPQTLDYARIDSLGLRLVYDLTIQLQGKLKVEHQRGATFTLVFGN